MSKKIALIVGAYPPDACGIGDYSYQLVHSDIDNGFVLYGKNGILQVYWSWYVKLKNLILYMLIYNILLNHHMGV